MSGRRECEGGDLWMGVGVGARKAATGGDRLKDWTLKGGRDEGRQLAYLFSWLCSTGEFPVNACWCCRLGYSWRKES